MLARKPGLAPTRPAPAAPPGPSSNTPRSCATTAAPSTR